MNVLLVAEESAGTHLVRAITASPHALVGVLTNPSQDGSRGTTVWHVAQKASVRVWPAKHVKDPAFAEQIRELDVDILLNAHSMFIMCDPVLDAPRLGSFNIHPGPLPGYAGANVVSWSLYRGETEHAVTIHHMVPRIDAGAIAFEQRFPVAPTDTALKVFQRCIKDGVALAMRLLDAATDGHIPSRAQDLNHRRYFDRSVPQDGKLRLADSADQIINFVRACDFYPFASPWGHPEVRFRERPLRIVKASRTHLRSTAEPGLVGDFVDKAILVATGDEWIAVSLVQWEGNVQKARSLLSPGERVTDAA